MPFKLNDKWEFYNVHVLPYSSLDIETNLEKNEIPTTTATKMLKTTRLGKVRDHLKHAPIEYVRRGHIGIYLSQEKRDQERERKKRFLFYFIVCRRIYMSKISRTKGETDYGQKGERMRLVSVLQAYVEYKKSRWNTF